MKLLNFTLIKLTICLVAGIVLAHYANIHFKIALYVTLSLSILLGSYWLVLRSKIDRLPFYGILTYLCMMGIGMTSYYLQNEKLQPQHYTNLNSTDYNSIIFKIKERLKPDLYNDKYIVSVKSFNNNEASGKILINIKNDSLNKPLAVDDLLFTHSQFVEIQKPLNPHQFDYSKYLELKQVYHQVYLAPNDLLQLSDSKSTIFGYADQLRTIINKKLIEAGFKNDALSIMNALLLGQRQSIDKTIYNNYVNSGTIHILAVSGLHVGIILLILNVLFRPLLYLQYGNVIRGIIIFIILWSFAVIAGLSPSVTRAVTMFSIISIAMHLKRPTNIYNTLVISAFIILLFKPTFLFEVGFQMSYLAVFGIVSVQPIIYNLWKPNYWVFNKLWQIFTVTIAAQAGVVPISLFYFHQFPGLFFVSNIVVIPFLSLILGIGLLVIAMALIGYLPKVIVDFYSLIIDSLNNFIAWVAQFEDFLLRDIPFTITQVLCSYLIIIALVQVYKHRSFKWVAVSLIGILCFQSVTIYTNYKTQNNAFIIFNKSRFYIIGQKQNNRLLVHHNLDTLKQKTDNVIKNYVVGETIDSLAMAPLENVYEINSNIILVIDSVGVYRGLSYQPDYILLRNSPKLNLIRVIDSLNPKQIIADASNYKSYLKRWKATCEYKKIPFHQTSEKGAFIIK